MNKIIKNYLPKIANFVLPIFLGIVGITFASTVGTNITTLGLTTTGDTVIGGTLNLTGLATFLSGLNVTGDLAVTGEVGIGMATTDEVKLEINADATSYVGTITGSITPDGTKFLTGANTTGVDFVSDGLLRGMFLKINGETRQIVTISDFENLTLDAPVTAGAEDTSVERYARSAFIVRGEDFEIPVAGYYGYYDANAGLASFYERNRPGVYIEVEHDSEHIALTSSNFQVGGQVIEVTDNFNIFGMSSWMEAGLQSPALYTGGILSGARINAAMRSGGTLDEMNPLKIMFEMYGSHADQTITDGNGVGIELHTSSGSNGDVYTITNYNGLHLFGEEGGGATPADNMNGSVWNQIYIEDWPNWDKVGNGTVAQQTGIWIDNIGNNQDSGGINRYGLVLDGYGSGSNIIMGPSQLGNFSYVDLASGLGDYFSFNRPVWHTLTVTATPESLGSNYMYNELTISDEAGANLGQLYNFTTQLNKLVVDGNNTLAGDYLASDNTINIVGASTATTYDNIWGVRSSLSRSGTNGAQTITDYRGYSSVVTMGGTGNFSGTNWYHYYAGAVPSTGGTVTNLAGVYIEDQSAGASNYGTVLADGADCHWMDGTSGTAICSETVPLSSENLLDLADTPITLVAGRTDTWLEVQSIVLVLDKGTAYDGVAAGEDIAIEYSDGQDIVTVESDTFINSATDAVRYVGNSDIAYPKKTDNPYTQKGLGIRILNNGGAGQEWATGTGVLDVKITYYVHVLGL